MAKSVVRDESLDGLRGFAALYVVLFHIVGNHPDFSQYSEVFRSIILAGSNMVAVFFVLSGYFIAESATSLLDNHFRPVRSFVIRRVFRILPVWFLLLTFMLFTRQIKIDVYFANLFFYFGNLEIVNNKWLPVIPAWTLQSEVIFYVVSAIFLRTIFNLKIAAGLTLWLGSILLAFVWSYLSIEYFYLGKYFSSHFFFSKMHYFAAGICINKAKYWNTSREFNLSKLLFWLVELFVVWLFLMSSHSHFSIISMTILAPSLVFLLTFRESLLRYFFKNKLFVIMGYASFSIYILQSHCNGFISYHFPNLSFISNTLINLVFAASVGLFVYYLVERPLIKWSKKF